MTAVVVPVAGRTVDERELIRFCRSRLAGFETPKRVIVIEELPTDFIGKIQKHKLIARFRSVPAQ